MDPNGDGERGSGIGCVVAAAVAGGVMLLLAVIAVVVLLLAFRVSARSVPAPMPAPMPPPTASATPVPDEPAAPPEAAPVAQPVQKCTVKLTGLGAGGTWYMIGEEIYEGDDALTDAVADLVAAARKAGRKLVVSFEVQPDAGITAAHVAGAVKACRAAGAETADPPEKSGGDTGRQGGAGEGTG